MSMNQKKKLNCPTIIRKKYEPITFCNKYFLFLNNDVVIHYYLTISRIQKQFGMYLPIFQKKCFFVNLYAYNM